MTDETKLSSLGQDLEKAISKLLYDVTKKANEASLDDKLKVIDRALKLEGLKQKAENDDGGFFTQPEED